MIRFSAVLSIITIATMCRAQDPAPKSVNEVASDVATKIGKVSSFSATVDTMDSDEEGPGVKATSKLLVSRLYGWKMTSTEGPSPQTIVTDFDTFYQYFPADKRAVKMTAENPEIKSMLTKPVTDMNPLHLLDQQSLVYNGEAQYNGETVYQVEGTTQSQLMPGGPDVKRTLSAWISVDDGLPRKTVESVGISTGTTVYRDVKVNPKLTPEDFAFTPPSGTAVIDQNEQMRKVREQMNDSASSPTPAP